MAPKPMSTVGSAGNSQCYPLMYLWIDSRCALEKGGGGYFQHVEHSYWFVDWNKGSNWFFVIGKFMIKFVQYL
jgi:hypothetical protein